LRLTVETGMPSACAARLKLSKLRNPHEDGDVVEIGHVGLLHGCKRHSRYFHLIEKSRLCQINLTRASPWRDQIADKTVIITGASQGIGAGLVNGFLGRGYNVVATSRRVSQSAEIGASDRLALVDGDIADPETAKAAVGTALARFGSIAALVNNAGIFFTKPFIDYTIEDYRRLAATNLEGFLHLTQRVVRQMLAQKSGGSIVSITTPMVDHPIAGVNASAPC
jgi:short chain dehydrogenase